MKHKIFLTMLALCLLLTACASPQPPTKEGSKTPTDAATEAPDVPSVSYVVMVADWPYYQGATDLTDRADMIFIGRITKIDFAVLDDANGMPVSASTQSKYLHTLYELEIERVFKGEVSSIKFLSTYGGMQGVDEEKQLRLQREHALISENEFKIPIWGEKERINTALDTPLLFVLAASQNPERGLLLNPDQSIYPLDAPTEPQEGISVQEILSSLGEDVWLDFFEDWEEYDFSEAASTEATVSDAPNASPAPNASLGTAPPIATEEFSPSDIVPEA